MIAALVNTLDFDDRLYSGITDDMLKAASDLDLAALSAGGTTFEEVQLLFLPAEAGAFKELVDLIDKRAKKAKPPALLVGDKADFDALFDATVRTKGALNIINSATAMQAVARLALERLEKLEAEKSAA
ncbi:hypothetical protein K2Z84_05195 [Candidatus Binatia bacterium]|nr:hypothetical protein [Candidatus Binatia bacterium]